MENEYWSRIYHRQPELFDAFVRAEDPGDAVARALREHAALDGRSVLEIGCGTGRHVRALALHTTRYAAIEPAAPMLPFARRRCDGVLGNPFLIRAVAERLPFRDGAFERIVAGWVLLYLRPRVRDAVLRECERVLARAPGAGLWLAENHWTGEFQELRPEWAHEERVRTSRLIDECGFERVAVVRSELRFPSADEAQRVLGALCGAAVRKRLERRPRATLGHDVALLRLRT